ncbi:MAG: hypothetical protein JXA90_03150 [Planctomycetes bacterium]|nr:hypothetical protein [Planctomycetota bacterium]
MIAKKLKPGDKILYRGEVRVVTRVRFPNAYGLAAVHLDNGVMRAFKPDHDVPAPSSVHPASEPPSAPVPPGAEALAKSDVASDSSSPADTAKEGT